MNTDPDIIIIGRGPSAFTFDWPNCPCDTMAVSSGIFAVPDGMVPTHFVAMDLPKYFLAPINQHEIAWHHDLNINNWPFCASSTMRKHVTSTLMQRGRHQALPVGLCIDAIETWAKHIDRDSEPIKRAFYDAFDQTQHHFGYQPGWLDYPNVEGWETVLSLPPNFTDAGPFGLDNMRNSVFLAVQVAARLGYRRMGFAGIFESERYQQHREVFARWHKHARTHGFEWINLNETQEIAA